MKAMAYITLPATDVGLNLRGTVTEIIYFRTSYSSLALHIDHCNYVNTCCTFVEPSVHNCVLRRRIWVGRRRTFGAVFDGVDAAEYFVNVLSFWFSKL